MALSLPPRDTLPGIGVVRQEEEQPRPPAGPSLGCDSELDGVLPTALVLETAASCSQGSSPHVLELPRKSTSSNNTPARVEDPDKNADAGPIELDAQNVVARPPSRPASSRRTAAGVKPKEHISIARKVTRILLGLDRGARSASCDAGVSWKPHEKLLKALDYRPRGHGRPFTEKYTLGDTLGTGGFGVVRDGECLSEHLQYIFCLTSDRRGITLPHWRCHVGRACSIISLIQKVGRDRYEKYPSFVSSNLVYRQYAAKNVQHW